MQVHPSRNMLLQKRLDLSGNLAGILVRHEAARNLGDCFGRNHRFKSRACVAARNAIDLEHRTEDVGFLQRASLFPAERFNIKDRGRLQSGYGADVVIFDPATVADRATWDDARLEPVGIDYVIVNGQVAVEHGKPTGCLPGRVLR